MKSEIPLSSKDFLLLADIKEIYPERDGELILAGIITKLEPILTTLHSLLAKESIGEYNAFSKITLKLDGDTKISTMNLGRYINGYKELTRHVLESPFLIKTFLQNFVFLEYQEWFDYLLRRSESNQDLLHQSLLRKSNGEMLPTPLVEKICCPANIDFILFQAISSNDVDAVKLISNINNYSLHLSNVYFTAKKTETKLSETMLRALCDDDNYLKSSYIKRMVVALSLGDNELTETIYKQNLTTELGHYILKEIPKDVEINPDVVKRLFSDGADWYKALKIIKHGYVYDDIDTSKISQEEKIGFLVESVKSSPAYWRERTLAVLIARSVDPTLFIEYVKNKTDLSIISDILQSNSLVPYLTSHKKGKKLSEDLGL